jgi:hypothetical protein
VCVGDMDGLNLAQDRDSWWDRVISVMHVRVPRNAWNCLTS